MTKRLDDKTNVDVMDEQKDWFDKVWDAYGIAIVLSVLLIAFFLMSQ